MSGSILQRWSKRIQNHPYGATLMAFLLASALTGFCSAGFARLFEWVFRHRLETHVAKIWSWLLTPLAFLLASELILRVAPMAKGTGIPQTTFLAGHGSPENEKKLAPLYSLRTIAIKILTLFIVLWAGASTGREGPTVHIAMGVFVGTLILIRRFVPIRFDLRSAATAGGAAGLAAAFNTPLAGVTFAVEELTENYFSSIKDSVLIAIIVAAITAQYFTGEYTYFGRLPLPVAVPLFSVVIVSGVCGLAGMGFSWILLLGARCSRRVMSGKGRYLLPLGGGLLLVALPWLTRSPVQGPGNWVAQDLLNGQVHRWDVGYPFFKMIATWVTYWSGGAGGIFAPALSVGASLGDLVGGWLRSAAATCALIGMAAFLSGAIQAPITAFVIIFEMTGHHEMLLPLMIASLTSFMICRLFQAPHLYQTLAEDYRGLLEP